MPHTVFSLAASSAPRPHWPATANTMSDCFEIWSSAISLHGAGSGNSFEYPFSSLTSGLASVAPCWKPPMKWSTGGMAWPPTVETVPDLVIRPAM